jgi:ABC-type sugar transport system permease subunit
MRLLRDRTVAAPRAERPLGPGGVLAAARNVQEHEWFGYVLALPGLVLIGLVVLYPVAQGIYLSFTNASLLNPARSLIGLQNYQQLFADPGFVTALVNSATLTVAAVVLELVLGMGLALLLHQKVPGIRFFRSITMVSWVIPVVATVMMFDLMVLPGYGFFNIIIDHLGLKQLDSFWFGNSYLAMPAVIMMHVWRNTPFFGIALFAGIQTIPQDQYEAAQIDGASALQRFRHITVPGVAYVAMIMVVLHVLWTFNNFDFVYIATGGGPVDATLVLPVYVYRQFWQNFQTGFASAGGVVIMLILITFTILYVAMVREKET